MLPQRFERIGVEFGHLEALLAVVVILDGEDGTFFGFLLLMRFLQLMK